MGQVPKTSTVLQSSLRKEIHDNNPSYLLIGSGRLARHLELYLTDLGLHFSKWNRSQSLEILKAMLPSSTHVLLAISDKSVETFFDAHLQFVAAKVIHFSGCLNHSTMISAHPLMSFSYQLFENCNTYQKIHFTLCGSSSLQDVLPGFPNSFSVISPEQKALYHAVCVFAGNFSNLLWKYSWNELKNLGIPLSALQIYLEQCLINFSQDPENSLTGPLVRSELETINSNLKALPPKMAEIYIAFVNLYSKNLHHQIVTEKGQQL